MIFEIVEDIKFSYYLSFNIIDVDTKTRCNINFTINNFNTRYDVENLIDFIKNNDLPDIYKDNKHNAYIIINNDESIKFLSLVNSNFNKHEPILLNERYIKHIKLKLLRQLNNLFVD